MIDRSRITQPELDALLGKSEEHTISSTSEQFYNRFITRVLLILAIWIIRIVVVSFFPEYLSLIHI